MPYHRWSTLLLLILHEESRSVPFPGLQKPSVFFRIYSSMLLLSGSEIFLVSETAKRGARLVGFIAPTFFFFADLRVEESSSDCARGERSCEPNAKAHHCDGA